MVGQGPQPSGAPHAVDAAVHRPTGEPTSTASSPFRWTEAAPTGVGFWWCRLTVPWEHREGSHVVRVLRRDRYEHWLKVGSDLVAVMGPQVLGVLGEGLLKDARWAGPIPEPVG